MYTGQMDFPTFLLYFLMGACAIMCMMQAKQANGTYFQICRKKVKKQYLYYSLFVVVYVFFATFRSVGENLGGSDIATYILYFQNIQNPESPYTIMVEEPLFNLYCYILRWFTDDHRFFLAITYGIMAIAYCSFVEKFAPRNGVYLPFLMLVFLYLKAFCTLRTGLAVALFLFAMVCFDNRRDVAVLLLLATVFIHRMSIAFAVFPVFYWLFSKTISRLYGPYLAVFLFVVAFLGVWIARCLQFVISKLGLLQGVDMWYLIKSQGTSLFRRFPMYFMHLLLYLAMVMCLKKTKQNSNLHLLKVLCSYDIVIMPATLVLGFWRANEYLYVARLAMWTILIPRLETQLTKVFSDLKLTNRFAFLNLWSEKQFQIFWRVLVSLFVFAWFSFRIYSEWDELKIMPYVFDFS